MAISLENAKKAAAPAMAEAAKNNWNVAVAIVDPGGNLVYYEKMDNTQLGSANVVSMNSSGINFTTGYKGRNYTMGFFDSGSNGVYFDDPTIPVCSGSYADFYCPSSTLTLSASIPVLGAAPVNVSYSVANANTLFTSPASSGNFAFANLSAPMDSPVPAIDPLHPDNFNPNFDWGLPFFFGRSVYTVTEGPSPNAATGALSRPFNAFSN